MRNNDPYQNDTQSFFPNFGQGPFPEVAGKTPVMMSTLFEGEISVDFLFIG